jgi:hypothetical protein
MKLTEVVVKKGKEKKVRVEPGGTLILSSSGPSKFTLLDKNNKPIGTLFNKSLENTSIALSLDVVDVVCKNMDTSEQSLYITQTGI